jgi:hypothetical protein
MFVRATDVLAGFRDGRASVEAAPQCRSFPTLNRQDPQ